MFLLYQVQSIQRHTVWYMNIPILLYFPFPILLVTANDNMSPSYAYLFMLLLA